MGSAVTTPAATNSWCFQCHHYLQSCWCPTATAIRVSSKVAGAAATTGGSDATVTTGITVSPPLLVLLVPLALAPMPYRHCQHLGSSVPLQPPPALIHPPSDAQIDGFLRCPGVLCRENIFEYGCPTSCKLKGREKGNYIATIYAVLFYFIHFLCIFLTFLFYLKYI